MKRRTDCHAAADAAADCDSLVAIWEYWLCHSTSGCFGLFENRGPPPGPQAWLRISQIARKAGWHTKAQARDKRCQYAPSHQSPLSCRALQVLKNVPSGLDVSKLGTPSNSVHFVAVVARVHQPALLEKAANRLTSLQAQIEPCISLKDALVSRAGISKAEADFSFYFLLHTT